MPAAVHRGMPFCHPVSDATGTASALKCRAVRSMRARSHARFPAPASTSSGRPVAPSCAFNRISRMAPSAFRHCRALPAARSAGAGRTRGHGADAAGSRPLSIASTCSLRLTQIDRTAYIRPHNPQKGPAFAPPAPCRRSHATSSTRMSAGSAAFRRSHSSAHCHGLVAGACPAPRSATSSPGAAARRSGSWVVDESPVSTPAAGRPGGPPAPIGCTGLDCRCRSVRPILREGHANPHASTVCVENISCWLGPDRVQSPATGSWIAVCHWELRSARALDVRAFPPLARMRRVADRKTSAGCRTQSNSAGSPRGSDPPGIAGNPGTGSSCAPPP